MKLFKTPRFFRILFPNKTWGFSRSTSAVYLTFDDGPNPLITPWVLDFLAEQDVKATFFCVGENVLKYPEIIDRMKREGHAVGNHSMDHKKGTAYSKEEYLSSVYSAQKVIDSNLFRPPYGRIKLNQTYALKKDFELMMWSWLSYDFDHDVSIETVIHSAKKDIKSGDILVFHDNPKSMKRLKELLPPIIDDLKSKNLEFKVIR
jgi:peptidoglycan/xylan/chitin deacetylase (PgdA/CDA1 family)